ncbi:putative polysaccharide biosynthesis protein [Anoxybacillus sp. J5B_2022]|uniref:putative polysaccharide biosynthesis protein n=1 Tax=Anoxybacillus sp. J5B_2022 TaxID=3003246 RepID=UPI002285B16E|nr:polysaccharide biosynthesis protein [Anoxybacillus sp. J5B_2022]MCZ0755788.1 polysaccharide biosynthesis protein [Anoxybacillus sp. J5B_2022]
MDRPPTSKIWQGTVILAVAAFTTKVLSAFYRIPYQNIVGDVGFYIYQQVYPIYGIMVALATYGYPVVISKLVAERIEENDGQGVTAILQLSFWFLSAIGIFFFFVLYAGGTYLAEWMGDEKLTPLLHVIAFSFLLLPFLAVLRGYFQGQNDMVPTAVSQVIEQLVRVGTIIGFSYVLIRTGHTFYEAGTGAIFGSLTGGFAALFVLIAYWLKNKNIRKTKAVIDAKTIVRYLFVQGLTVCIANMVLTLTQLVDAMSLLSLLKDSGVNEHVAQTLKGVYDRGQPLLQLGTVVATSFSLTLVPLIAGAKKRGDQAFILEKTNLSVRVGMVVGIGAALGLACLIRPTNVMLFQNDDGSLSLAVLVLSIFFTTMSLTMSAILQGIGYEWLAVIGVGIAVSCKWLGNVVFVHLFGVTGASLATLFAYMLMSFFLYRMLQQKIGIWLLGKKEVYSVMRAALVMVVVLKLYIWATEPWGESRLGATGQALAGVLLGGSVYIIMVLKEKLFSPQEASFFPFGEKLRIFLSKMGDER